MTVCDNLGEHLIGNIYIKVRENNSIKTSFNYNLVS